MHLHFRGITYAAPYGVADTDELAMFGKYRGNCITFKGAQPKSLDSAVALKYRGTIYLR